MALEAFNNIPGFSSKPRIAVLTDICNEPDDAESMTRFLLYSNEFQIDALVATTSTWQKTSTHKDEIHKIVDAYGEVVENLNAHVPSSRKYPEVDSLRSVIRSGLNGYGMEAARGPTSEGTDLLIRAVDAAEKIIWVLIWGGSNVLAQALLKIQKTRKESEVAAFVAKLRIYAISDQDDAGPWIRLNFPKMFYIASVHAFNYYGNSTWTGISGELYYGFNEGGPDTSLVTKEWLKKNVQIGPYGSVAYPDPVFIPEGDTPTFLSLIQNGLTDPLEPGWGGWGGRYLRTDPSGESQHYSDVADQAIGKDGRVHVGSQVTIWRWREAYQGDFAARIQWTLSPDHCTASHAPVVVLNGDSGLEALHWKVGFGETIKLDASESWDPNGSDLEFRWMHYQEPSATQWNIKFEVPKLEFQESPSSKRKMEIVEVTVPGKDEGCVFPLDETKIFKWGPKTYHLILEVVNKGKYPMRMYRRFLVQVVDFIASN
ncbi:cellulose-binding protein [Amylocarpus encephaloides]|uniref:Cellulose-binding protein n=1 Tax=Amylocarpus encephaloides TaxID=45428 RepID=A0A9P7YMG8_9HELO|nr:cellulose-binding protein [Amylocarpus encephaloides]